jgi:sensor histidine kinase regulating citrate/malate metabolism
LRNNGICVQGRSSGIGLYICHVLIEKYQGWMHITDRIEGHPEKGTQVSVWFPKYNQSIMHDSNQP